MSRISPFIWFNGDAEAAAKFYVKTFPASKITHIARYPKNGPGKAGSVMTVAMKLAGQDVMALNGGKAPGFEVTGGISLMVACKDQKEIDTIWKKILAGGGKELECGWIRDRWNVHWQIVPRNIDKLMAGKDKAASARAFQAMLGMVKLDIAALKAAARG
jgi:predicted 3-demethylubiquinone-9 3-methyltransferase (glyoxalase superfamily)